MVGHSRFVRRMQCVAVTLVLLCGAHAWAGSQVGGLHVTTTPPGAAIYVANDLKGISPCAITGIGIGPIEVKAVMPGYSVGRQTVTVNSDKISACTLRLERLPNVGNILVLVEPTGSEVSVDRVPFGRTPCRILNIKEGTHHVLVGHDGYRPLPTTVTVVSGKDQLVKGELVETGESWLGPAFGGFEKKDIDVEGHLDIENASLPDDMPEAKAFDPVRKLLDGRKYDQALQLLANMSKDAATSKYVARINRDKRYIGQVKGVVEAGYKGLKGKVGHDYKLKLKGGIVIEGKITRVTTDKVELDMHGAKKDIELGRVDINRVIKLAAMDYAPDKAANQALFAVLYSMEGEWDEAVEALQRSAAGGYNVTDAMNYFTSEKEWAAAQIKEKTLAKADKEKKTVEKKREGLAGKDQAPQPVVLIDRHRGGFIEAEITGSFERMKLVVKTVREAPTKEDLAKACVLIVRDQGEGEYILPYDEESVKSITTFVNDGGGFVFFGRPRLVKAGDRGTPYDALLMRQFKIAVLTGRISVDPKAPRDLPRYRAIGLPKHKNHPITKGVEKVYFDLRSPAVVTPASAVVMATPPFMKHSAAKGACNLLAARQYGKGRVVVFACVPDIWDEDTGVNALRVVRNAVGWAATPKATMMKAGK